MVPALRFDDGLGQHPDSVELAMPGQWDRPHYTNFEYPFEVDPRSCGTTHGCYRVGFEVPGLVQGQGRAKVWRRGLCLLLLAERVPAGLRQDSKLPSEFDASSPAPRRRQRACGPVLADGTYLEDQDHWWLSGIFRGSRCTQSQHPRSSTTASAPHSISTNRGPEVGVMRWTW